jgi:hypothetical protein
MLEATGTIKRILNFNADFRLPTFGKFAKIVEINSDNLSRYSVAQNVGFFPRYVRYGNIKKYAAQNGARLNILYNATFSHNLDKAKRWGINSVSELEQRNFFPATIAGIKNLQHQLQTSQIKNWVLLLSTYTIPHFYSYLYADESIRAVEVQHALKQLFDRNRNTVFIGEDTVFDKINNDKFLTSQLLPPDYQPRSTLIINGDDPAIATDHIIKILDTEDIVIKPLSAHSGIGIHRANSKYALHKLFVNMHEARKQTEAAKIKMTLDVNNTDTFWFYTRGNNPFVHCQEYVPTHSIDNREITYRAVATAYIDENDEVGICVECIYPKKSDPGNFISRIHNEIKRNEIEDALCNPTIKQALIPGLKMFIKNVINYNESALFERLLSGNDAEFLKGLKLKMQSGSHFITHAHAERLRSIKEKFIVSAPQVIENLWELLTRKLKPTIGDDGLFRFSQDVYRKEDFKLKNLSVLTQDQKITFLSGITRSSSREHPSIKFISLCKQIQTFVCDPNNFSGDILYSDKLYNLAIALQHYYDKLKNNRISRLVAAVNLFELKKNIQTQCPALLPAFNYNYDTVDPLFSVFQTHGGYPNCSDDLLIKTLIALYNLPTEALICFPKTTNGLLISDYQLIIADVLYNRYYGKNLVILDSQQVLLTFFANWYAPNAILFSHVISEELAWKMRSRAIKLLAAGIDELNVSGVVTNNTYISFLVSYLPHCTDEFSLYKAVELMHSIFQVKNQNLNEREFTLFNSLENLINLKTKELKISSQSLIKIQEIIRKVNAYFLKSHLSSDNTLPSMKA